MKSRTAQVVPFLFVALGAVSIFAAPTSMDDCEQAVAQAPESLGAWLCFFTLSKNDAFDDRVHRELQRRVELDPANAFARVVLAAVEERRGEGERAVESYLAAAEGFARSGRAVEEVRTRLNLATHLDRLGRLEEADAVLERAALAARTTEDSTLWARVSSVQGQLAYNRNDLGRAWRLFKEMESAVFPEGPVHLRARCVSFLGGISALTGRSEQAMTYHQKHVELLLGVEDIYTAAVAMGNVALHAAARWGEGRMGRAEAVALARRAVELALDSDNRDAEVWARHHLAGLLEGGDARDQFERALTLARGRNDPRGLGLVLRGLTLDLLAGERADLGRAEALANDARDLARDRGDLAELARALVALAEVQWAEGSSQRAIGASQAALEVIEDLRDQQADRQIRTRFFSHWAPNYARLSGRLFALYQESGDPSHLERALEVIERMRARALLDALDAARATPAGPAGPDRARRDEVLAEIAKLQRELIETRIDRATRTTLLSRLAQSELEESRLRERMARADPDFAVLRRPAFPRLDDVRRALTDGEALLSFQLANRQNRNPTIDGGRAGGGAWLLSISRDETHLFRLPDRREIEPAVQIFVGLLERRDGAERAAAAQLYHDLFEQALSRLAPTIDRLIIVPDGTLHRLPFGVLSPTPDGALLAERYRISIAPSIATWMRWRKSPFVPAAAAALVLADPTPPGIEPTEASTERGWALASGLKLGGLPHARVEAADVVRLLGRNSLSRVGERATERFVKQTDLRRFGVLHFAVHAVVDDEQPDRSALLLTPGDAAEDGLLQIREVVELDLDGRVVVLSACRSASGNVLPGEGVLDLARAFFQGGARAVLGSRWPLRDDDAAALFGAFYRQLAQGRPLDEALQRARIERIEDGAPAAAWAGVVLLGDGKTAPLPGRVRDGRSWTAALTLGLAALILVWAWLKRPSR